jgi:glycosyltransferase involved in cell wall biosynthesis
VDRFIANSRNVAARVRRCYQREADVLLPPVDPEVFRPCDGLRTHFLAAARLVPYKRLERIIDAFRLLPEEQLLICGDGPQRERLLRDLPPNVRLLGHVPQEELVRLMQAAHALICAADEDLGLTPMEAQACGTPVLALRRGGYLETVVEGESGLFFDEPTPQAIAAAVRRFRDQGVRRSTTALHEGMRPFFAERFRARLHAIVEQTRPDVRP